MSKDSNLADLADDLTDNVDFENGLINDLESSQNPNTTESSTESSDFSECALDNGYCECESKSTSAQEDSNQDSSNNISELRDQLNEWKDKYVRAHADFENVKKRLERDKNQALEYAYEKIAKDLLPIIDTLERAKEAAKEHSAILEGINLTQDNLLKALQKNGIEEISTSGEFDPNLHECIMQVQNEELNDGDIAQVLQKGYVYKERTLRPAMVAVVKNN